MTRPAVIQREISSAAKKYTGIPIPAMLRSLRSRQPIFTPQLAMNMSGIAGSQLNYWVAEDGATRHGYTLYGELNGSAFACEMESKAITWKIRNDAGAELPATGGPGTWICTFFGTVLLAGTGLLIWKRRKMV